MEKEQIEQAADKYQFQRLCDDRIQDLELESVIGGSFMDGAQWRIDSAWHKPSAYGEELTRDVEVIAKTKRGYRFGKFDVVGYSNEYIGFVSTSSLEYALSDVLEYAYLDDLLPDTRKEAEP